jgi:hypothetical protein
VERDQQVSVQSVPEPKLTGCPAIEELLGDVDAVPTFRSRCQPEKLLGFQMVEQPAVRGRHGMVELIDDDDVEEVRLQLLDAEGRQRLDGRENVLPLPRLVVPHVEFTEGTVLHKVAVGAHRLLENLLAMGDEEHL